MEFAFPLGNGLFKMKILQHEKMLILQNLVHRSKCVFNQFHNLFFMKLIHHKLPFPQFDNENCGKIVICVLDAHV